MNNNHDRLTTNATNVILGFRETAELLQRAKEELLDQWVELIEMKMPTVGGGSPTMIRDSIPHLLDEIIADLFHYLSNADQPVPEVSKRHVEQRIQNDDYRIDDMLAEYYALKAIMLDFLHRHGVVDHQVRAAIDETFDKILLASVKHYARIIEDLRIREQHLAVTNARKDEFLAIVSHELRNPLAAILASAEVMAAGRRNDPADEQSFCIIRRQANVMVRLVGDLLDVTSVSRGTLRVTAEPCDLRHIIIRVVDTLLPQAEQKHHKLTFELPPKPLWVMVDPLRIEQSIGNIVANAIKYTPQEGDISIKLSYNTTEAILHIQDNGMGMKPQELNLVFQAFYRAPSHGDRAGTGLGVGLYLAKSLIELNHGHLTAMSSGLGAGSLFIVTLPLHEEANKKSSEQKGEVITAEQARKKEKQQSIVASQGDDILHGRHILIVEDNADIADPVAQYLRNLAARVSIARTGHEGLRMGRSQKWDVVVLDIGLPDIDGYQVVRTLKTLPELAKTAFIAASGYGQTDDVTKALQAGFHVHLLKPIELARLSQAILKILTPRDHTSTDPP